MRHLYLDAIYPKVCSGGRVVSLPVLVVLGVRENGEKVLLSPMTTGAESADGWQLLLSLPCVVPPLGQSGTIQVRLS